MKAKKTQVKRRQRSATVAVRKKTTLLQMEPRPREIPGVLKPKVTKR
jgi:hypothetical protein